MKHEDTRSALPLDGAWFWLTIRRGAISKTTGPFLGLVARESALEDAIKAGADSITTHTSIPDWRLS